MTAMIFATMMLMQDGTTEPIRIQCDYNKMGVVICRVVHPKVRICLPVLPINDIDAPNLYCRTKNGRAVYTAGY